MMSPQSAAFENRTRREDFGMHDGGVFGASAGPSSWFEKSDGGISSLVGGSNSNGDDYSTVANKVRGVDHDIWQGGHKENDQPEGVNLDLSLKL